jgi:hypothetical protein
MPISLTYCAVAALTYIGVDDAKNVVDASMVVFVALIGLYGRYRAGGIHWSGWKGLNK